MSDFSLHPTFRFQTENLHRLLRRVIDIITASKHGVRKLQKKNKSHNIGLDERSVVTNDCNKLSIIVFRQFLSFSSYRLLFGK